MTTLTRSALAALAVTCLATAARADYPADYNRMRAQRLFLSSPSPYKTYTGYAPGYYREYATPTQDVREWRSPAYLHERITPRGYERYTGPSVRTYAVTQRPVVVVPYYRPLPPAPPKDDYYPPVP